jgi:competence protein ComEC
VGIALAFALPFHFCAQVYHLFPVSVWLAGIVISAGLGILIRPPSFRIIAFIIFAIILCISRRAHQMELCDAFRQWAGDGLPVEVVGKVISPPMPFYEDYHFLLRIDSLPGASSSALRGLTLNCIAPSKPPQYDLVTVQGVYTPPRIRRNPFEYDEFRAMMGQSIWGRLTAKKCEVLASARSLIDVPASGFRNVTLAALDRIADYDDRAILMASILGTTEYLSPYINGIFRKAGIYHLIAISGLHTVILTGALFFFLQLFRLNRTIVSVIVIAVLWAYPLFIGMIPSLVRATIMMTFLIAALLFEKKRYGLQALGIAGTVFLALSPESLFSPGYQLSFGTTFGLITLMPIFNQYIPKPRNRFLRGAAVFLGSSFAISVICFLTTAPILLYHFGTISYFGIIANFVAVFAMTGSLWSFFAGLLLQAIAPFAAGIPLWASERCMDFVVETGKIICSFPWSQGTHPAPPMEWLLFFVMAMVGVTAIRPELLKVYLLSIICLAAILMPADSIIRRSVRETEVVRFALPRWGMLGIRWPAGKVCLISPGPAGALTGSLSMQVMPWIRHSCDNRLDRVFLPRKGIETVNANAGEVVIPASATVLPLPEPGVGNSSYVSPEDVAFSPDSSFHSVYTPGLRCTCAVRYRPSVVEVKIIIPGFDTVFSLPASRLSRAHPVPAIYHNFSEENSAVVFRFSKHASRAFAVVPSDHPLR